MKLLIMFLILISKLPVYVSAFAAAVVVVGCNSKDEDMKMNKKKIVNQLTAVI
jgi:hypothetical protein